MVPARVERHGAENFTVVRVDAFRCHAGEMQSIYRDAEAPGLGARVTSTGACAHVFESRLFGAAIGLTDRRSANPGFAAALVKTARMNTLVDEGGDPGALKAEQCAAFRKKIYESIDALRSDLDAWLDQYNNEREHQGRWCYARRRCVPSSIHWNSPRRNSFLIDRFSSNGPTTCQIEFRLIHVNDVAASH